MTKGEYFKHLFPTMVYARKVRVVVRECRGMCALR